MTVYVLLPVGEAFGLFPGSYKLDDCVELLNAIELVLLLKHQHEVVSEAALHHHPVHRTRQVDVCRQKHYVFSLNTTHTLHI